MENGHGSAGHLWHHAWRCHRFAHIFPQPNNEQNAYQVAEDGWRCEFCFALQVFWSSVVFLSSDKPSMTPRSTGLVTFAGLFVAAGFAVFFFAVKHQPWLASVAPFGEDPYDSVGSFAVQLAGVAASIAVLRVLARASGAPRVPLNSTSLCLRAVIITLLAIFITAVADLVALLRYPNSWWHSSIG